MAFDFDMIADRRNTDCVKWDAMERVFHRPNVLPMWIADMDFPTAPAIQETLRQRLERGIYGYSMLPDAYRQAVAGWMERRHGCRVEKDWIVYTPGVVNALSYAVQALTEPGDEVLVMSPVYGPFYDVVTQQDRTLVTCPLQEQDLYYTMDLSAAERRITPKTKALLLCSPHNPVGRVWKRQELEALAEFCLRHDLYIIADEIHHDLVFEEHTVFLTVSETAAQRTILCTAPSKTFNIAGLSVSNAIIPNEELRQKFKKQVGKAHAFSANAFAAPALIGAYDHSEDWLDELLVYLKGNAELFCQTVNEELAPLRTRMPEGTYLCWVDVSGLGLNPEEIKSFFVEKCGVAPSFGTSFGKEGEQFVRFNLACSRSVVQEALRRLKAGLAAG